MRSIKRTLLVLIILINSITISGCWNYREIDKLDIVTGIAIDKGINNPYMVTVEIAQTSGGKESKTKAKIVTAEGKTLFDTARNSISTSGEKLYWSHSRVIILSKDIASEGVSQVFDWYTRDSETREDVNTLISMAGTAKEILTECASPEEMVSTKLNESIKNQKSLSKAPIMDILQYEMETKTKGLATVIPTVNLTKANGKTTPQVVGTAIIKDDKLLGFLSGEETKDLMFIRNEVKSGLLIEEFEEKGGITPVSLEIFKSKTKVKPNLKGNGIEFDINTDTIVALGEVVGTEDVIEDDGRKKVEKEAEETLKNRIHSLVKKVQDEYAADIFGFGAKLKESNPKVWITVSKNWEEVFKDIKVNVNTKVHIKNSGITSKTLQRED